MFILVVDDSTTMQRIIKNTLNQLGLSNVILANDGLEALAIYEAEQIELIITDWNMPNMNGLDLVREVRKRDQDIPIVMVTTEGGKPEVITALKAGVNNYIIKPFTPIVLKEKISLFLGRES